MHILLFFVHNYADVVFAWCQVISTYYHTAFQFVVALPDKGSSAGKFEIVIIATVGHSKREPLAPCDAGPNCFGATSENISCLEMLNL